MAIKQKDIDAAKERVLQDTYSFESNGTNKEGISILDKLLDIKQAVHIKLTLYYILNEDIEDGKVICVTPNLYSSYIYYIFNEETFKQLKKELPQHIFVEIKEVL